MAFPTKKMAGTGTPKKKTPMNKPTNDKVKAKAKAKAMVSSTAPVKGAKMPGMLFGKKK
jgi:hypothetical protein